MSFQILNIVLYGRARGQFRNVELKPGALNIITGGSKTGKSALIDIVEYCMADDQCKIAEGVIRKAVLWVGVRLQIRDGQVFIARKLPSRGKVAQSEIHYETGSKVRIPDLGSLRANISVEGLKNRLSAHAGILENIHQPPAGHTRSPVAATIRHALYFLFQPQDEIISKKHLFHRQSEPYMPQTIKDVFPFFLGAVSDDYVRLSSELRNLKRKLKLRLQKLSEHDSVRGSGLSRAVSLLAEARDTGLYRPATTPDIWEECVAALQGIQSAPFEPEEELFSEDGELERLREEKRKLGSELRRLKEECKAAQSFADDKTSFSRQAVSHVRRLESVGLFKAPGSDSPRCPLCQTPLEQLELPGLSDLKESLHKMNDQIRGVEERSPQLDRLIREFREKIDDKKEELKSNRESMEAVISSRDRLRKIKDQATRRAHVLGRIGLYLESLPPLEDHGELKREIEEMKSRISSIERQLDNETVQDRLDSILSRIDRDIGKWAEQLGLEHSENPMRLDKKKLLVVADSPEGPIPMDSMGSGENWVGYHLIALFALHNHFTKTDRPVPRFLFVDQPSQVYFPADKDLGGAMENIRDEDREAVARMFKLACEVAESLAPNFQIVVTDHADIAEKWFQDRVVERWRDKDKLVPVSWSSR